MNSENTESRSSTAFALSLAAGILILFGSLFPLLLFAGFHGNPMNWMHGMGDGGMMRFGYSSWLMGGWYFYIPAISGIIVLIGAVMLNKNSKNIQPWAILVIIFSVIGLLGMGFSILGGILGIIGGGIALSKRNNKTN